MEKFQATLEKWVAPVARKFAANQVLNAIKDGMISSLPVLIIGSLFTIIANFPYKPYLDLIAKNGMKAFLTTPIMMTMNILALVVAFFVAYHYAKSKKADAATAGLVSMISFLIVTPFGVKAGDKVVNAIPFEYLGTKGLFVAILTAIVVGKIYSLFIEKGWVIKMPDGVPESVAKSFTALLPATALAVLFLLVRIGFSYTSFESVHPFIYKMLQKPLMHIGTSPAAVIVVILLNSLFFFFGIHSLAINAIVLPVLLSLDFENLTAFNAGQALPHIVTWRFFYMIAKAGGTGAAIGLALYLVFFAKSKQMKVLSRISLPAVIFNVNEPLIFGMPIMLNPIMFLPFMATPVICFLIAYAASVLGLVNPVIGLAIPEQTPIIISGLLQSGPAFAIMQVLLVIVSAACYMPFARIVDKQALTAEKAAA